MFFPPLRHLITLWASTMAPSISYSATSVERTSHPPTPTYPVHCPRTPERLLQRLPLRRKPHTNNLVREETMPTRPGPQVNSHNVLGQKFELRETVARLPLGVLGDAELVMPEFLALVEVLREGLVEETGGAGSDLWLGVEVGEGEGRDGPITSKAAVDEVLGASDCDEVYNVGPGRRSVVSCCILGEARTDCYGLAPSSDRACDNIASRASPIVNDA